MSISLVFEWRGINGKSQEEDFEEFCAKQEPHIFHLPSRISFEHLTGIVHSSDWSVHYFTKEILTDFEKKFL